jgi:predicted nucleotidyltransferase
MVSIVREKYRELDKICSRLGVQRLELFGSAATDDFDPTNSDLDFIVEFRPDHDLGPWLRDYLTLRDELVELFGYPVDLVMSSAMKNRHFIREANRTRELLYGA